MPEYSPSHLLSAIRAYLAQDANAGVSSGITLDGDRLGVLQVLLTRHGVSSRVRSRALVGVPLAPGHTKVEVSTPALEVAGVLVGVDGSVGWEEIVSHHVREWSQLYPQMRWSTQPRVESFISSCMPFDEDSHPLLPIQKKFRERVEEQAGVFIALLNACVLEQSTPPNRARTPSSRL